MRVEVTRARIAQVLGIDPPTAKVREVLTGLGFGARWVPPDRYVVRVPYWRTDVRIPDDVVEEVARIIGYDQIPATHLAGSDPGADRAAAARAARTRARPARRGGHAGSDHVLADDDGSAGARAAEGRPRAVSAVPRRQSRSAPSTSTCGPTLRASLLQTLGVEPALPGRRRRALRDARASTCAPTSVTAREGRPAGEERLPDRARAGRRRVSGHRADRWGRPSQDAVDFFDAKAYVEDLLHGIGVTATVRRRARVRDGARAHGSNLRRLAARRRHRPGAPRRRRRLRHRPGRAISSNSRSTTCCRSRRAAASCTMSRASRPSSRTLH